MELDSWTRLSKRDQSALQSRYDLYLGFGGIDGGDEEARVEFSCPFCSEDFDDVGLCFHIDDEHPVEAKNGVCPVCAARVGSDFVAHLTMQHGDFFKMQRRRRFCRGSSGSHSTLSLSRKELIDGNLKNLLGGSSYAVHSSDTAADPFLSSLIYTFPMVDSSRDTQPMSLEEESLVNKSSDVKAIESVEPSLSGKEQKERACRSELVRWLLLSTVFDDNS
ncbi:protein DEHYDRATION-INDUCED 19 homolog 2-like [Asparagus officinalis]|uniref:protein DEHYDRATION-INDUCED 19 homolog 2-like n=1 Tax=Asparagus officinalis TaxID=4686 RepID=UPI00098DF07D|nr:protein DEHYDRATION-INDUCED 19 homolog 2-like [Asparagus officinalis]